jgi:hypothetical protein
MATQISDPSVLVNNVAVYIVPNTLEFDEGFGEQDVMVQSAGGGVLDQVFSDNVETSLGGFKFSLKTTIDNIALARSWKANRNQNVVTITATTPDGTLTRTYTGAAIVNNFTVQATADGVIELEWKGNKPTI